MIEGEVAGRILEALARYRFVTLSQFVKLGVGRDEKNLRNRLNELLTAKLIERQEFRLGPSAGRLPNVHWLTAKGVRFLTEASGEPVEAPSRYREIKASQFAHRMLTVDALIAADRWAKSTGQERPSFKTFMQFGSTGIKLGSKDAIADAIFAVTDTAGQRRVYVLEVYCSQYSEGHSSHALTQLEHYVLAGDTLDSSLSIPATDKAARVLVVCDTPELKSRLVRSLSVRPGLPPASSPHWGRFHFKDSGDLNDFGQNWQRVREDTRTHLPA